MTTHKFNPCNFGTNGEIVKMYFGDGDIQLTIGSYKYDLDSDENSFMEYHTVEQKAMNSNHLHFKTESGIKCSYTPNQLLNFRGVKDSVIDFIKNGLDEKNIKFENVTHELMNEIMNYHKEELVNKHLDNYNEEELQKLSLIL